MAHKCTRLEMSVYLPNPHSWKLTYQLSNGKQSPFLIPTWIFRILQEGSDPNRKLVMVKTRGLFCARLLDTKLVKKLVSKQVPSHVDCWCTDCQCATNFSWDKISPQEGDEWGWVELIKPQTSDTLVTLECLNLSFHFIFIFIHSYFIFTFKLPHL